MFALKASVKYRLGSGWCAGEMLCWSSSCCKQLLQLPPQHSVMLSRKNGNEKVMEFMDDYVCDCKWDTDRHLFHCSLLSTMKTGRP